MNHTNLNRGQEGFTLVELAIVMIIIGLLIGGILKGQELIANAQVTATVSQVKGIDAAISTFRDMYDALPGDMQTPTTRIPNCAGNPVCNASGGNGNGRIDLPAALGTVPGAGDEGFEAWNHLSLTDLITGIDGTNVVAFGQGLPKSEIAGGYFIGFTPDGNPANLVGDQLRPGHYLVLNGTNASVGAATGAVTPTQAARIDRKIDDGVAATGSVQPGGPATCRLTDAYNEGVDNTLCSLFLRVQG